MKVDRQASGGLIKIGKKNSFQFISTHSNKCRLCSPTWIHKQTKFKAKNLLSFKTRLISNFEIQHPLHCRWIDEFILVVLWEIDEWPPYNIHCTLILLGIDYFEMKTRTNNISIVCDYFNQRWFKWAHLCISHPFAISATRHWHQALSVQC